MTNGPNILAAIAILENIIKADSRILADPSPSIVLGELGASIVNLFVRPWAKTSDFWSVRCDLMESIKLPFL